VILSFLQLSKEDTFAFTWAAAPDVINPAPTWQSFALAKASNQLKTNNSIKG